VSVTGKKRSGLPQDEELDQLINALHTWGIGYLMGGSDRDLIDVKLLVQQKVITLEGLDEAYREVLPHVGKRPFIKLDPQRFAERYTAVRQQLQQLQ
jgi:hypothetical protein